MRNDQTVVQPIRGSQGVFDVTWNERPGECNRCGASIGFGKTKKNKWVLFDLPCDASEPATMHMETCDASQS